MASLTSALSSALSGMQVASSQMQLVSNNVANAQQAGYTRKQAVVQAVTLGDTGGGVTIAGYTRATDSAMTASLNAATTDAGKLGAQNSYLKQVQTILNSNTSNPGISDALAKFQSAFTQFAAAPESTAQQQTVIQAGNNLAGQIRSTYAGVQALDHQVMSDTADTVSTLNNSLAQIAKLNSQISLAVGAHQQAGDLQDQRDALVTGLSKILSVTVMDRPNGQIALYTPAGFQLLDGMSAQNFSYDGTNITTSSGTTVTNDLTGGQLEAEVQFRYDGSPAAVSSLPGSEVIRKLKAQLTAITQSFTDATAGSPATFANAYNSAASATGELASGFFTANVSYDPGTMVVNPNLLNGTSTLKQASGAPVVTALNATRSFTADGLSVPSGTYTDLGTAFLAGFQQAANTINTANQPAQQQVTYYQQSLSNATGVNVDSELVSLTTLQNSYAASAHVISTINQMFTTLMNAV